LKLNQNKNLPLSMVIISGVFLAVLTVGSLLIALEYHDRMHAAATLIALVFAMAIAVFYSLGYAVGERVKKRRLALKALGKQGIRVLRRDKSARLAYKGILRLIDGRYPESEELLLEALNNADIRQNQLFCIEWLKSLYEAEKNEERTMWCCRRAVELAPDEPACLSALAAEYFNDNKLSGAEYYFNQTLKYDPNHGFSYYCLAIIHMMRGEDEEALKTLKTLEGIQQNHPLVHEKLAEWYEMHDDDEAAQKYFNKAIFAGYKEPDELSRRLTAIRMFNHADGAGGENLPREYYRIKEPKENTDA